MYITYTILAVTILVSLKAFSDQALRYRLMLNPHAILHEKQWERLITHAFIHGDYMHLLFNMYVLYMFGEITEKSFVALYDVKGHFYFALLYVGGIFFSTIITMAKYKDNPNYNALGASGAVSSVVFAFIVLYPMQKMGIFPLPPFVPAFIFGPLLLLFEYLMAKRGRSHIAHEAHFAGALFGILFMSLIDYHFILNFLSHFTR
ncbi:MAG: rhomboid family intramembrane serine protease [Crocinitomicaceae bacterium]|nr:rhomboid family intramembrane serine protease [Crocinitomicaceae bacterium]MBK8924618.1 rhomboid family intramembrane serine protease [Crocinitomicaceae bacterium]